MTTLKQIAADLGVSHALVSRVLNNRMGTTRVSERVRKAIIDHARELDYRPSPLALALKSGQKGAIGVFFHGVGTEGSELSLTFIRALTASLCKIRFTLWLQFFETDDELIEACDDRLLRKVDGLILAGIPHEHRFSKIRWLVSQGLPVVAACHGSLTESEVGIPNFQVNTEQQCYLPTKHLLEKGCRKVAHFHTSPLRYAGYLKAHAEMGVRVHDALILHTREFSSQAGRTCAEKLLAAGTTYDAIVTQSDAQAAGAMRAWVDAQIPKFKWPLITGVDDSPIARFYSPMPITSVTAEMEACAQLAVTALVQKIEGGAPSPQLVVPKLILRESTER